MNIGIAFDLKPNEPPPPGAPDDWFEEFDAPVTIRAIGDVFRSLGHEVRELGNGKALLQSLLQNPPDLVFNFAEGTGIGRNRESRVPAVCEMLGIPYTGSDAFTMAAALDKDIARRFVAEAGVAVPRGIVLKLSDADYDGSDAEFAPLLADAGLTLPVIAKPVCEGSSKGVRGKSLIRSLADFGPTVRQMARDYRQPILVEEFIDGPEVTVGIVGNDPPEILGVMSIAPKAKTDPFVYSVEVKRDFRKLVDYACPAALPHMQLAELERAALTVFDALECRDVARVDFRLRDGIPYFLEVNPLPGLNPESSDLVIMANLVNVTHTDLVTRILNSAIRRLGL